VWCKRVLAWGAASVLVDAQGTFSVVDSVVDRVEHGSFQCSSVCVPPKD